MAATIHQLPSCGVVKEDRKQHILSRRRGLLWKEFCRDPSEWCHNRNSPRHPDFRHKAMGEPLCMDSSGIRGFTGEPCLGTLCTAQIDSFTALLRTCTRNKDLARGTSIHHDLVQRGLLEKCSGALVIMYAKCGELGKAKSLLDTHKSKDVATWTALIAGYARAGQGRSALDCLERMQCEGILPNEVTYVFALKACATIRAAHRGKQIHDEIARQGLLQNDIVLGNALVDMYAKCGAVSKAQQVLAGLPSRNVVSWSALIAGYAEKGEAEQALICLEQMQHEGILPNAVTYVCVLKACAKSRASDKGKQIHEEIVRQGLLQNNVVLGGALVDMYAKCGILRTARLVLEELPSRDVVSWSALIAGYAQEGQAEQALICLERMQHEGILPNAVTYVCALKACAAIRACDRGKKIHDEIAKQRLLQNNISLGNALVDMYAKCGDVSEARRVLEELHSPDVVSWSALIAGYVQEGEAERAMNCLEQMQHEGILPNAVTFACALKACAMTKDVDRGKQIHDEIVRQRLLQGDIVLGNALVDMYAKCGAVSEARQVLEELPSRNVVSWTTLIAGYTQEGEAEQALNCLEQMRGEGILPNAVTYVCALKACALIRAADKGKQIHNDIARQGLLQTDNMFGNVLVDMYAKCGAVSAARQLLEELPSRTVVSWNALIAGYAHEGEAEQALNCLEQMQSEGILPNVVTYVCALKACATIQAADRGREIHNTIARQGLLQQSLVLGGALVDMYAKCGDVSDAQRVLEELPSRDVVAWNALIAGYVQNGQAEQALSCLEQMQHDDILPDAVTYVSVLKACAIIKASERGKQIHEEVARQGLLQKSIVLGGALVDMYAKCGDVSEAQRVLKELPSRDVVTWNALITGYAQEGQAEQALNCFQEMQCEGILPNALTCTRVLNVCSHRGLVEEGQALFVSMSTKYRVEPSLECYTCMIDLFGRAGHLDKAVRLIQDMPSSDYSIWNVLLGACGKCTDVKVGEWAFEQAVKLDQGDGSVYVLMANIYVAAGLEEKAKSIEAMRIRNKAWKKPGRSWGST